MYDRNYFLQSKPETATASVGSGGAAQR